jgi:putative inorganic carbon (hco3(-)) transporter
MTNLGQPLVERGLPSPTQAMWGVCVISIGVLWHRGQLVLRWTPIYTALLVFHGVRGITAVYAGSGGRAFLELRDELRFSVVLVLVVLIGDSTSKLRLALGTGIAVLAGLCAAGVARELLLSPFDELYGFAKVAGGGQNSGSLRAAGTIGDPNYWGQILALWTPLAFALMTTTTRRLERLWWLGCGGMLLLGISFTQSRGTYAAIGVGMFVMMLLGGWKWSRLLFLSPLLVAVALINPITGPRLATLVQLGGAPEFEADVSIQDRKAAVEIGTEMTLSNPIVGVGLRNFEENSKRIEQELYLLTQFNEGIAAHNAWLEVGGESGVIGLVAFIVLLGTTLVVAVTAAARWREHRWIGHRTLDGPLVSALAGGVVGWAIGATFLHINYWTTLFSGIGMIAVLSHRLAAPLGAESEHKRTAMLVAMSDWRDDRDPLSVRRVGGLVGLVCVFLAAWIATEPEQQFKMSVPGIITYNEGGGEAWLRPFMTYLLLNSPVPSTTIRAAALEGSTKEKVIEQVGWPADVPVDVTLGFDVDTAAMPIEITSSRRQGLDEFARAYALQAQKDMSAVQNTFRVDVSSERVFESTVIPPRSNTQLAFLLPAFGLGALWLYVTRGRVNRQIEAIRNDVVLSPT